MDFFLVFQQKKGFWGIIGPTNHGGNHASRWIRDLWSKGKSLILSYFLKFFSFCTLENFFCFSKKLGFGVFLVHPIMVSVLLCASVERCFVSRMRDFFSLFFFMSGCVFLVHFICTCVILIPLCTFMHPSVVYILFCNFVNIFFYFMDLKIIYFKKNLGFFYGTLNTFSYLCIHI